VRRSKPRSYTVVLEEEPRGHWHAYAPAVRGCFAGGRTRSEALRRYRSALKLHLEALAEHGDAPPVERRPPIVQVSL
jgi:predicted RNase H-like HicB family nuclease